MSSCSTMLHEARVTVDVALLERAAIPGAILMAAAGCTAVALTLAVKCAAPRFRPWLGFHLAAVPLAAGLGWLLASKWNSPIDLPCVEPLNRHGGQLVALAAALWTLSLLQLSLTLTFHALSPRKSIRSAALTLLAAITLATLALFEPLWLRREFSARVEAVMPVPNLRPRSDEGVPLLHLGQTRNYAPEVQAAGASRGLFFTTRVLLDESQARAWSADRVTLTATNLGDVDVPIHLVRDLVSVDVSLPIRVVEDRGPAWFPLAVGNRLEFVGVNGRGGTAELFSQKLLKLKKLPPATTTVEVMSEEQRDGLHVFKVQLTEGAEQTTEDVVRSNGELVHLPPGGPLAFEQNGRCKVPLLKRESCTCDQQHILRCVTVQGDVGESLMRGVLAVLTLGLTEIKGMGDLGAGEEGALVATRWRIDGVEHSVLDEEASR